jgi:hypothetical protein
MGDHNGNEPKVATLNIYQLATAALTCSGTTPGVSLDSPPEFIEEVGERRVSLAYFSDAAQGETQLLANGAQKVDRHPSNQGEQQYPCVNDGIVIRGQVMDHAVAMTRAGIIPGIAEFQDSSPTPLPEDESETPFPCTLTYFIDASQGLTQLQVCLYNNEDQIAEQIN